MALGGELEAGDSLNIGYYEDWMFDQVIDMIVAQYGRERDGEVELFRRFYEAPFQRNVGIRLAALDGERVCGFQSYFYWPYVYQGEKLRSFQSGNSLVSPDYRGRRIFARLLNFLAETEDRPEIDFLMGFPTEMSYESFIRNGWDNPLDLSWYIRPINPLSIIGAEVPEPVDWLFKRTAESVDPLYPRWAFALSKDDDFVEWRRSCPAQGSEHLYFHHREGSNSIRFELKPNRRGRIQELVIGDIVRDSEDPMLLKNGLQQLVRAARSHRFLSALSIPINRGSADRTLEKALRRRAFLRINKKINFIVKPIGAVAESTDPAHWQLYRSDIDTW